jgi:hypothetical protein
VVALAHLRLDEGGDVVSQAERGVLAHTGTLPTFGVRS